ncbi:MAG: hypothetical protein K2M07_06450 [Muribaculaceae bacterium]|nr:hypothetical protein [Muribaculaceae bacterium]
MKKNLIFLPLIVAMMTACSSNDPVIDEQPENPVTPEIPVTPDDDDDPAWELTQRLDLTENEKAAVSELNLFSYELMREFSKTGEGVYCCSPASISIYMGMLANATGGESRQQILSAMHLSDMETVNTLNAKLMHYLPCEENGAALSINNRFWVADRFNVAPEFTTTLQDVFNGKVKSVDFSNPMTVPTINKWISDKTNGLIPSLLDGDWKDFVNLDMASANTVYFKGNWSNVFKKSNTVKETFYGSRGNKEVEMMHQETVTGYASNDKFTMVTKSFEGYSVDAEFYLPADGINVKDFTLLLTPEMQQSLNNSVKAYEVTLSLPKFEINCNDEDGKLNRIITDMGVNLSSMDFSSMGLLPGRMELIHKTALKMYEEGAELAAVTGGYDLSLPFEQKYPEVNVNFNRPFCYIIRHSQTGIILMAGVVSDIE